MIIAQDENFCHDVNYTRVHCFTLLQMSSPHLLVYPCCSLRYICVCEKKPRLKIHASVN